jgi:hypothetical protein
MVTRRRVGISDFDSREMQKSFLSPLSPDRTWVLTSSYPMGTAGCFLWGLSGAVNMTSQIHRQISKSYSQIIHFLSEAEWKAPYCAILRTEQLFSPVSYGARKFITVFTSDSQWILSNASWIQSTPYHLSICFYILQAVCSLQRYPLLCIVIQ